MAVDSDSMTVREEGEKDGGKGETGKETTVNEVSWAGAPVADFKSRLAAVSLSLRDD